MDGSGDNGGPNMPTIQIDSSDHSDGAYQWNTDFERMTNALLETPTPEEGTDQVEGQSEDSSSSSEDESPLSDYKCVICLGVFINVRMYFASDFNFTWALKILIILIYSIRPVAFHVVTNFVVFVLTNGCEPDSALFAQYAGIVLWLHRTHCRISMIKWHLCTPILQRKSKDNVQKRSNVDWKRNGSRWQKLKNLWVFVSFAQMDFMTQL
jgi:hypothetical protein